MPDRPTTTPSPTDPHWLAEGWPHVWLPYAQMATQPVPPPAVSTSGSRIHLADGRELIDGVGSWWTACHGYCHPHIVEAVQAQAATMPHVMFGGLANQPAFTLAKRLAGLLPGDLNRVFFVDSGSVSVEVAMKMSIQYWLNQGRAAKTRFVSFKGGYHGDTLATMSVCDPEEGMHTMFGGVVPEQHVVDLPTDEAGRAAFVETLGRVAEECAAVLIEPLVQGAGGMRMHAPETLRFVAEQARAHDLLLVVDEIFTGFGRTGTMFAIEQAGIVPDVITLSKALTGGTMALACAVAREAVYEAFLDVDPETGPMKALMHGPTFMANPLACAAANASLDLFEVEDRLGQVAAINRRLTKELAPLREVPGVVDVRTLGAIGAVQLTDLHDIQWLRGRFLDLGVWLRPFGDIVYTTPAFTIDPDDLNTLISSIIEVVGDWSERFGGK